MFLFIFLIPGQKRRHKKHRLINKNFAKSLYKIQKENSLLEVKTDCQEYFLCAEEVFKNTGYKVKKYTRDLYGNEKQDKNLLDKFSQFELIFFQKKIPIAYMQLKKK